MKQSLKHGMMAMAISALSLAAAPSAAADDYGLLIQFHTDIYDEDGVSNTFTLVFGGTPGYLDVDCGYGSVEVLLEESDFDEDEQELTGSAVSCQVSADGIVKVYGDYGSISYFSADGVSMTDIQFYDPTSLTILSLQHNYLTGLDLSELSNLQALYLNDNDFAETGLRIGPNKPLLSILDISITDNLSSDFNLSDYPGMLSFECMLNPSLTSIDASGCPDLLKLSIDMTNVSSIDLSNNPNLIVLNISDTAITDVDLSQCPGLQELYCTHTSAAWHGDKKLTKLDLTNNPYLYYLFANGNKLTSIDVTQNVYLDHLWLQDNYLTSIDLSKNENLTSVRLEKNCMDFATLPTDPGYWNEYEYEQRAMEVPDSYLVGTALDLSTRVLRPDTETWCAVFTVSDEDPYSPVELDEEYYTYADGVVTINSVVADSVYVSFANSELLTAELKTAKFKVKSADQFGADDQKAYFTPSVTPGTPISLYIGVDGASADAPKEVIVDWGDGSDAQTYRVYTATEPSAPNITGTQSDYGTVKVYVKESEELTALAIEGVPLVSINVTAAKELRTLRLQDTQLPAIDLQWNRCLTSLILTGNQLASLDLTGNNVSYGKNVLLYCDLSNNGISNFTMIENVGAMQHFDLSHNNLTELSFTNCDGMEHIDVSYNQLEALKVNYCEKLAYLDASHNKITEYTEPETNVLEYLDLSGNAFTFANLPSPGDHSYITYIYAPQSDIDIADKAPGIDLSAEYVDVSGQVTAFAWKRLSDGSVVEDESFLTCENGVTRFNQALVGTEVYCELSHPAFPDFAGDVILRTTAVTAMEMPTHVAATFHTLYDDEEVSLSLTSSKPKKVIYIDWNGDGTGLEEYTIKSSGYTLFTATTRADRDVKVLTYDEEDYISVFSISGASMNEFDASGFTGLTSLTVMNAGIESIVMPEAELLTGLNLQGNNLTELDLTQYPNLVYAWVGDNLFSTLDVSKCTRMTSFAAANCQLEDVTLGNNDIMFQCDLGGNLLTDIDLSGVPDMQQLYLNGNLLRSVDLSGCPALLVLALDGNYLDFTTLPRPSDQYVYYTYANQRDLEFETDGHIVDLSHLAYVQTTTTDDDGATVPYSAPTTYRWWLGYPVLNDDGELEGEDLYVDDEYALEDGVTTFLESYTNVVGTLENEVYPGVILYTPLMDVTSAGIKSVPMDKSVPDGIVRTYNLQGQQVAPSTKGLIIRTNGSRAEKVIQ